jgi:biopolymer transport protein ExbB/TolQ
MSDSVKRTTTWFSVLPSLVTPICLGLVFYIGLQAAIQHQAISDETVLRYLTGHPVSKISVGLFFVGIASLLLIGLDVMQQFRYTKLIHLDWEQSEPKATFDATDSNEHDDDGPIHSASDRAAELGRAILQLPSTCHDHYLWQRIANVLQSIFRNGSTAHVEQELKYLAELDVEQQHQRYSLVQILIWATPMLGFLGTVLGISQALGGISVGPDNNFQTMMDGLKGSLYVAFDTTALALTLSMVLMFGQFLVDRFESQLLRMVSHRAHTEISNNFDLTNSEQVKSHGNDFDVKLMTALEAAAERQTELWRESLHWAEANLTQSVMENHRQIERALSESIDQSIDGLARTLDESISRADQAMTHRWEQWQVVLSENARQTEKSQNQFAQQTQAVCELLKQTAQTFAAKAQPIETSVNNEIMIEAETDSTFADSLNVAELNQTSKPSVAESPKAWISVSPEFLCDAEDHPQVILPFTKPISRQSRQSSHDVPATQQTELRLPTQEVILPFLKKSA